MLCSDIDSSTVVEAVMESQKIVIKAKFGDDIRRIAIEQNALESFKDLKKILKKIFKTSSSFNIGYYDEESDLINIRSNLDLQTAIRASKDRVLRIVIEEVEEPEVGSSDIGRASSLMDSTLPSRSDTLFSDMEFSMKLEQFITQTVCSKPFIDTLAEKLLPHVLDAMKNPQPPVTSNADFDLSSLLMQSLPPLQNTTTITANPITEVTEDILEEEDKSEQPQELIPPAYTDVQFEQPPVDTTVERLAQEPTTEESTSAAKEEEPESFVIVRPTSPKKPSLTLRSLLNLFKLSSGKRPEGGARQDDEDDEEIQIPNLEETLTQLKEMGFTDRDSVVKTLKFHKRFQEGLNEVVEDLLLQHEEEKKATEATDVSV